MLYIAGAMTNPDPWQQQENLTLGMRAFMWTVQVSIASYCPHLSGLVPGAWDLPHEVWMAYDMAILEHCSALWFLPGWRESKGSSLEYAFAQRTHKPCYFSAMNVALEYVVDTAAMRHARRFDARFPAEYPQ